MEWSNIQVVFSGLLGGFIGFIGQQVVTNRNLQDSLDSKSGWRKELFEAVSQSTVDLKSIYTLRATLRYKPKADTSSHLKPFKKFKLYSIVIIILGLIANMLVFQKKNREFWSLLKNYIFNNFENIFLSASKSSFIALYILITLLSIVILFLVKICRLMWALRKKGDKYFTDETYILGIPKRKIDVINLEDVLRIKEGDDIKNVPLFVFNFDSMTKTIIDFCDECTNHDLNEGYIPFGNAQKFRLYTRYMLKHHWEELSVPNYRFIKKLEVRKKNNEAIRDTIIAVLGKDETPEEKPQKKTSNKKTSN